MKWDKGFTSKYYATIVDPKLWRDTDTFDITGGSIKLNDSSLRESADIKTRDFYDDNEYWIRIYMEARQPGESPERPALFTGLASVPNHSFNGNHHETTLTCYSVLKPAEDVLLPLGWYAQAGANAGRVIYELLKPIVPAPVYILGTTPALEYTLVAEAGETHLSMVDYVLSVIGWRMRINGDGSIWVMPQADSATMAFDADSYDILELSVDIENNWFDCPNVFRAVSEDMMAIARDESPESRFSIVNRGREIWMEETNVVLTDEESIGQYAERRLNEEQFVAYSLSYTRRFHPDVRPTDRVDIYYPRQGISGIFYISSQSISLGYGAPVGEDAIGIL